MNVRNAWRSLHRYVSALAVPDTRAAPRAGSLVLLSCHDVDRSMREEDRRFSPLLDGIRDVVEQLGYTTVNLTHPYAVFGSVQVKGGTITINYRALLVRLRAMWYRSVSPRRAQVVRLELETRLYRNLLKALNPEVVFSIQPPPAMCGAARQLGVTIIEAMHGTNISLRDQVFRAHMVSPDHLLPRCVLSFDEVTHATVLALCVGRDIVAMNWRDPWLQACRRLQARAEPASCPESAAGAIGTRVLVTLQWGYDGERPTLSNIIPNGILHPALEAVFAMTARSDITFLVRMHPIQMTSPGYRHHRRYLESLAARYPNVELKRATAHPLPLLLDEVSAHVTMSSSAVGEAAAANVPSLMLCPTLHPGGAHDGFFRELESSGLVTFGKPDAEAIVAWIDRCALTTKCQVPDADVESSYQDTLQFYADMIDRAKHTRREVA